LIRDPIFALALLYYGNQGEIVVLGGFYCVVLVVVCKKQAAHFQICPAHLRDTAGIQRKDQVELVIGNWQRLGKVLRDELYVGRPPIPPASLNQVEN
jgi:hypothetical protein